MSSHTLHIIITANYSPWSRYSGGGQRSAHHLAEHLCAAGCRVDVVYTKACFEKVRTPSMLPYQVHWATFPALRSSRKNIFRMLSIFTVYRKTKQLLQHDTVIHSNGEEGALLGHLKQNNPGLYLVFTPRYPSVPEKAAALSPTLFSALLHPGLSKYILLHKCLRSFDILAPTSHSAAEMLRTLFKINDTPVRVIPNGIPDIFFGEPKPLKPAGSALILIFFGRLSETKGIDTLLGACLQSAQYLEQLIIIGRGEYEQEIHKLNKQGVLAGKIQYSGWMAADELAARLRRADVAVLPSREESFGNAIAEAMASGLPVITTSAGSVPEVVGDSNNGIIVEPGNIAAVAKAIEKLSANPQYMHRLARNGNSRVRALYSWKNTAARFIGVYTKKE